MQDLHGKIDHNDKSYAWWAGNASPDAPDEFAVHCRREHFGVTRYLTEKPDQQRAEKIAHELAPQVDSLS